MTPERLKKIAELSEKFNQIKTTEAQLLFLKTHCDCFCLLLDGDSTHVDILDETTPEPMRESEFEDEKGESVYIHLNNLKDCLGNSDGVYILLRNYGIVAEGV